MIPQATRALPEPVRRRLTLVRYLYGVGADQSRQPEPFASFSVLPLHDASEMLLQIAAERWDASAKRPDFLQYWPMLREKGIDLPHRAAMERLNSARVGLKHRGVLPARSDVEDFRVIVREFIADTMKLALDIDFDRLSMGELVQDGKLRDLLLEAERAIIDGDHEKALEGAAVAFKLTLRLHRYGGNDQPRDRRRYDLRDAVRPSSFTFSVHGGDRTLQRIGDDFEKLGSHLSEAITVVGYNLNFDDFLFFKSNIPVAHEMIGGNVTIEWMREPISDRVIAERCVAFAVDAAIRLRC